MLFGQADVRFFLNYLAVQQKDASCIDITYNYNEILYFNWKYMRFCHCRYIVWKIVQCSILG